VATVRAQAVIEAIESLAYDRASGLPLGGNAGTGWIVNTRRGEVGTINVVKLFAPLDLARESQAFSRRTNWSCTDSRRVY